MIQARVRTATRSELSLLEAQLPLSTPTLHREYLARQDEGSLSYLVAWLDARPVGHGLVHWEGPRDEGIAASLPDCPEIFHLGVSRSLRGQGIGTQLMQALESLFRERGRAQAGLGVALENHRARALYERLGYEPTPLDTYVDRWSWLDASGRLHQENDACQFLVKTLV